MSLLARLSSWLRLWSSSFRAERSVGGQGQQVAGDVEGAGAQGALVSFGLHVGRARRAIGEMTPHALGEHFVLDEQGARGVAVRLLQLGVAAEIRDVIFNRCCGYEGVIRGDAVTERIFLHVN